MNLIMVTVIPNKFLTKGFPIFWKHNNEFVKGYIVKLKLLASGYSFLTVDFSEAVEQNKEVKDFFERNKDIFGINMVSWTKEYASSVFVDVSKCKRLKKLFIVE